MDPLLSVQDLSLAFGAHTAVKGLSFTIGRGETVALVGESGSGKSATALAILRLIEREGGRIKEGRIVLHGAPDTDLTAAPPAVLRALRGNRVAMIFQEPMTALNPVMRLGDQVAEVLRLHRGLAGAEARAGAISAFARARIPDPERRAVQYPHELSGGMRQRVMIAIALACEPELLIADEPTTALDVTIQAQILELVRDLRRKLGMAIIWITHDLGVIAGIADRVMVMYGGQIVEMAPVTEVFANPRHPYARALLGTVPALRGARAARLRVIEGQPPILRAPPAACPFAARCAEAHDLCRVANPARHAVGPGHDVACHLADPARLEVAHG